MYLKGFQLPNNNERKATTTNYLEFSRVLLFGNSIHIFMTHRHNIYFSLLYVYKPIHLSEKDHPQQSPPTHTSYSYPSFIRFNSIRRFFFTKQNIIATPNKHTNESERNEKKEQENKHRKSIEELMLICRIKNKRIKSHFLGC